MMIHRFAMLFAYERNALLEALRRDLRAELWRAESKPQYEDYHRANYRSTLRILETLNPKQAGNAIRPAIPCENGPQSTGVIVPIAPTNYVELKAVQPHRSTVANLLVRCMHDDCAVCVPQSEELQA